MVNLPGDTLERNASKTDRSSRRKRGRNLTGIFDDRNQAAQEGAADLTTKQLMWDPQEIGLWHGQTEYSDR